MIIMAEEDKYMKMVQLIEDIEASAERQAPSTNVISLAGTFASVGGAQPKSYHELVALMEGMEAGRHPKEEAKQQPQPQPHLVATGVEQAKYAQVPVGGLPQATPQRPERQKKQREAVSKELGQIVGRIGAGVTQFGEMGRKRINIKDLVLPSLSLADQISELERIIEGLKQQIFDGEHMEIVAQEVYGLRQYIQDTKRRGGGGAGAESPGELERSLRDIRDQRIDEAITLIENYGAGNASGG
jgi:uncharacterized protein YoaH (UPF0181 family)